jgi:NAD(P)-binding Rossmann-like domain
MRINIVGAGMAGLLAANILRRHDIIVYEKQSSLPNNHHAVLRFRTPIVGDALGIQFRKVNMIKTYVPHGNVVADSLAYSYKSTGEYRSDRSIIAGTVISERYVAPLNLIEQMSKDINIKYEIDYEFYNDTNLPVISTIPMPTLMYILNYPSLIGFTSIPGIVATATITNCDAYVSVLFPGEEEYSRATITGDQLIVEFPNKEEIDVGQCMYEVKGHLGIYDGYVTELKIKKQDYFKIIDINNAERKKFQRWATVNHNIYSLGRYATWRPKLLLDDLIDDIRKIEGWVIGAETNRN